LIAARTVIPRGAARTSRYRDGRATTVLADMRGKAARLKAGYRCCKLARSDVEPLSVSG